MLSIDIVSIENMVDESTNCWPMVVSVCLSYPPVERQRVLCNINLMLDTDSKRSPVDRQPHAKIELQVFRISLITCKYVVCLRGYVDTWVRGYVVGRSVVLQGYVVES